MACSRSMASWRSGLASAKVPRVPNPALFTSRVSSGDRGDAAGQTAHVVVAGEVGGKELDADSEPLLAAPLAAPPGDRRRAPPPADRAPAPRAGRRKLPPDPGGGSGDDRQAREADHRWSTALRTAVRPAHGRVIGPATTARSEPAARRLDQDVVGLAEDESHQATSSAPSRKKLEPGTGVTPISRESQTEKAVSESAGPEPAAREAGEVGEDVVGSLGRSAVESRRQRAPSRAGRAGPDSRGEAVVERPVQSVQRDGDALLQRGRRADGEEIVHLADRVGESGRRHDPADPPAGDAEGLRGAADGDRALPHARQRGDRDVLALEPDVLVDLVGDGRAHRAGRRGRAIASSSARVSTRPDGLLGVLTMMARVRGENAAGEPIQVERLAGLERNEDRLGVGEDRVGAVVLVERLEHDHLVARIHHGEQRGDHRLGGAAGDGDLPLGIHLEPVPARGTSAPAPRAGAGRPR